MFGQKTQKAGFNIGLSLAGAVSGGAYSAGVFDFLVEALSEWQNAKDRGETVPQHEVFISAISGTSAGGITAAMGLASLAGGVRPVEESSVNPRCSQTVRRVLPELYDIWVRKVRLFDVSAVENKSKPEPSPALLDISDMQTGSAPASLLNSDVLTGIARNALSSIRAKGKKYPFFADPTHLFLTHTNLDGVPYPIEFATGEAYTMMVHEGRAHFAVSGLGEHEYPTECDWLAKWNDAGVAVDLTKLGSPPVAKPDGALKEPFETFAQAALTTSAFPFGFSARRVTIDRTKLRKGAMPFDPGTFPTDINDEKLSFLLINEDEKQAHFVCVDGGAMNNEPFEIVRWAIRDGSNHRNTRDPKAADRAVILIAPFPPHAAVSDQTKNKERQIGIDFIGKALIPALINQARFKAEDLIAAADPSVYSRFLISPKPKLASEPLYAFGGFLDEQFREYDFQLGRRNCQRFLRHHFSLDPDNPIFGPNAAANFKAIEDAGNKFEGEWPIVPLIGSAAKEVPLLEPWPLMPSRNLIDLRRALQTRCDLLVAAYAAQIFEKYPSLRIAARLSWWRHRRRVIKSLMAVIKNELKDHLEPPPRQSALQRFSHLLRRPRFIFWLLVAIATIIAIYEYLIGDMS